MPAMNRRHVEHVEHAAAGTWLTRLAVRIWRLLTHRVTLMCIGGAAGTCARYSITLWIGAPLATLLVNVSGAFVLGAAAVIIRERLPPEYGYWYLLIGTGFCGGYTTFSTFEYETLQMVQNGRALAAIGYVLGSVLAGFVGVYLAVTLLGLILPKS